MGEPAFSIAPQGAASVRLAPVPEPSRPLNDATMRKALEQIPDLSLLEEQLLFRVCCLSLQRGYAWMGQAELAKLLRCKERALRDATTRVCELGLLVTVRTWEGLTYLPQWKTLGLPAGGKSERLVKTAGGDRQNSPMHYRSTNSGSDKKESSRARGPRPRAAASFSDSPEATAGESAVASASSVDTADLAAVADKFGLEAARDVRHVLASPPVRQNPAAGRAAVERLLRLTPSEIRTSPGACFRGFVRLACMGMLAPPPSMALGNAQEPPLRLKSEPDPLQAKAQGLRDRLSYLPSTHPHRSRFVSELAALELQLVEREPNFGPAS